MKKLSVFLGALMAALTLTAQTMSLVPAMSPDGGHHEDSVVVSCSFPIGCSGVYWTNGAEINRQVYTEPVTVSRSSSLSIAGVNKEGRIITDIVTRHFEIEKVTPAWVEVTPKEGIRRESFYVTKLAWKNALDVELDLSQYKEDQPLYGEPVVWVTNERGKVVAFNDYNGIWQDGYHRFKAYIYKNYKIETLGKYVMHIAPNIFRVNGELYADTLHFHYEVAAESSAPEFTPEEGSYEGPLTVSISYPTDGSAFYKFYKLNGAKAKSYTAPLVLTESATIEAYGMDEDFTAQTAVSTANYTITIPTPVKDPLPTPSIQREGNTITLSAAEGKIRYWLNYRYATAQDYTAPFEVTENGSVACVAYTEDNTSEVVELAITDFIVDRGEKGDMELYTPQGLEELHLRGLSKNGRFAVGYTGSGIYSRGFIWDLSSDYYWVPTPSYVNQLWGIEDDGTAYGWHLTTTDVDEQTTDDDIEWGTCKNGVWTALAGPRRESDTIYSTHREWALVYNTFRIYLPTGERDELTHSSGTPAVMSAIGDDGTVFGTYLSDSNGGIAVVYTVDGRWRRADEWLRDEKNYEVKNYNLTGIFGVTDNGDQLLMSVFPKGLSANDAFTRGLSLQLNVQVKHLAPSQVDATQMQGSEIVRVSWHAPLRGGEDVKSYKVWRDGQLIQELAADTYVYYDRDVTEKRYTYTLTAVYEDEVESENSIESVVEVKMLHHLPVRDLSYRQIGLNGIRLNWLAPIASMPKLQYFDEQGVFTAFGGLYDSEWGVRIPASDLSVLSDKEIRTFQFVPSGRQEAYEIRLYYATPGGKIDAEPFYRQQVSPDALIYGSPNTIMLLTPQKIGAGKDIVAAMYVVSAGNYDVLGVQFDGYRKGYTDLCRIDGVFDEFVVMSEIDPSTQIVLPIGIGICSEEELGGTMISQYVVSCDGERLGETRLNHYLQENVAEGAHRYTVAVEYMDGTFSPESELEMILSNNYVGVKDLKVTVDDKQTANLEWTALMDNDESWINYGDLTPRPGLEVPDGIEEYMVSSVYPSTMTLPYNGDYEIVGAYFYPTASASFSVVLATGENTETFVWEGVPNVTLNELNIHYFEEPVVVNSSIDYRLSLQIQHPEPDSRPVAYDSSNRWQDGMSNLISVGTMELTLVEFVQSNERPNWLMGLILHRKGATPMPIKGYYVVLDGIQQNEQLLSSTQYKTGELSLGEHTASIRAKYETDIVVAGREVSFEVNKPEGVKQTEKDELMHGCYDILGRRVGEDSRSGLFIINGKKQLR